MTTVLRALSAILAFAFADSCPAMFFVLLGDVTGVHGSTRAPMWWRIAYACFVLVAIPTISVLCARAAWRSGAHERR